MKSIKIVFDRKIYSKKAIEKSVVAFHGLAKFKIAQVENGTMVTIMDPEEDVKHEIKDEFINYVLSAI